MTHQDIGDVFTDKGLAKLKLGQLLRFNYEGSMIEFKIVHLNRKSRKVLVEPVDTMTFAEFEKAMRVEKK